VNPDNRYILNEVLRSINQTADKILDNRALCNNYMKGEALQELIRVSYTDCYKNMKYPEIRFLLFDNGFCKMEVLGK